MVAERNETAEELLRRLHPYQYTALQEALDAWKSGIRRQLVVLPTGTGKTVLFAVLPLFFQFRKRVLVLVHRDTLAEQARDTIREWNPYAGPVGIEMGNKYRSRNERIVVASVQTIGKFAMSESQGSRSFHVSKRLLKFHPDEFDAVVVDECHHAVASGYKNILRYFGFLDDSFAKVQPGPNRILFGVTATPKRLDKRSLYEVFDLNAFEYPIEEAIREGWLVNPRCFRIRTSVRLDDSDLNSEDLEKLSRKVNIPARNQLIVQEWLSKANDRKTVCFAVDVQHAVDLALCFRNAGVKATAVWGDDPDRDRKLKDFKRGRYQVICNCEILTEGYDDRSVSAIILARPTESESLFKQMIGRGTRLEPGVINILQWDAYGRPVSKRDCIILEVLDAYSTEHSLAMTFSEAFDLPAELDLNGAGLLEVRDTINHLKPCLQYTERSSSPAQAPLEQVKNLNELHQILAEKLQVTVEEIDLFRVKFDTNVLLHSQLAWHRIGHENYVLVLPYQMGYIRLWRNHRGVIMIDGSKLQEWHRFVLSRKTPREHFGHGFRAADEEVLQRFGRKIFDICRRDIQSDAWKSLPASPATMLRLKHICAKHGIPLPETITRGEACLLMTKMIADSISEPPPTGQQSTVLKETV
jgi:superfamily II DNA or RNA helicase